MSQAEAGKGSSPRKQNDAKAFVEGWDRIFGKKTSEIYDRQKDVCPDCKIPWYKHDTVICEAGNN